MEDPIAATATALAPAALGIVRTSGKGCIDKIAAVFSRPKALLAAGANTLVYGWIIEHTQRDGTPYDRRIDEVMLGVYRAPKSFTGEDMVEIYCHGGVSVVREILALLLRSGFRQAERGEYTFRAYINGKADLTKAEAVREIIDSKTGASRQRAASRLSGGLLERINSVKKLITDSLASIEVAIEYPEDEETIADSFDSSKLTTAQRELALLVDSWRSERLYQEGEKVVLCGRTNAGKSRLFNALLKEDRSIVSDIEGTTRDYLESTVSFDGIPATIFDTAGLRWTSDPIEAQGVERTKELSCDADLLLYLVDSVQGLNDEDKDFIASASKKAPVILVWNKSDKEDALPLPPPCEDWQDAVSISAKMGIGIGDLIDAVKRLLTAGTDTTKDSVGLGSERQKESVAEALERVTHALKTAESGEYGLDAVVQDLEDSLDSLGEVTGEVTPDDILESIFSHFCVGK